MHSSPPNAVPFMSGKSKRDGRNGKNKLPKGFPGTVKVSFDQSQNPIVKLHEDYRRYEYGHGDEDFLWFVENVLSAQNASKTKFAQRKATQTVSEIFSVPDEAFGLVVLLNELHCWETDWNNQENKRKGNKKTGNEHKHDVRKLFVNRKSGKKDPWDDIGKMVYKELCKQIEDRRTEEASKTWEAAYKHSNAPKTRDVADRLNQNVGYHMNNTHQESLSLADYNYKNEALMAQFTFITQETKKEEELDPNPSVGKFATV